MSKTPLSYYLDRYATGELSAEEWVELRQLLQDPGNEAALDEFLDAELINLAAEGIQNPLLTSRLQASLDDRINRENKETKPLSMHSPQRVHFLRRLGWAAAIIILFGIVAYLYTAGKKEEPSLVSKTIPADILPGGNKAVLTLADGSTIILDSASEGVIAQQGNVSVVKLSNGEIRYDLKGVGRGEMMMNTMATPKGGQYTLTLPDGSKVWLNAASSLTYPAVFVGGERKVRISGEAYFEIKANKEKPFVVDVEGKLSVQVLGTSFNINSYPDEGNIKTTLLEGSVKVISTAKANVAVSSEQQSTSNGSVILKPGQQAQQSASQSINVINHANVEQVLAWKSGMFNFDNMPLTVVMKQLERWYDIEVKYEGKPDDIILEGEMYRRLKLADVLFLLQKMGVHPRMEGRTLIITQ